MVRQAQHLIKHGEEEVLSPRRRQFLYGQDHYIALIISRYLEGGNDWVRSFNQSNFDNLLKRISTNANLHKIDAVGRLYGSSLLFGYEHPADFDMNEWEVWENREKYLPVPFSVARTLAFVKQRFDIVLDYPFP